MPHAYEGCHQETAAVDAETRAGGGPGLPPSPPLFLLVALVLAAMTDVA